MWSLKKLNGSSGPYLPYSKNRPTAEASGEPIMGLPQEGRSFLFNCEPVGLQTSTVTAVIKHSEDHFEFKTLNSHYELKRLPD